MEMNAYADMPEKVKGGEKVPSLEELAPDMFKQAAVLPTLDQALRWNFVNFGDDFEPHLGENVDWNEIEPLAKADAEAQGVNWEELDYEKQYEFAYHHIMEQMKTRYADVERLFTGKFPLTIYRAITLEEGLKPETLSTGEFGVNWSWAESGAHPYCGNINLPTYVFRAQVTKDQIDWSDTAGCNVVNDLEKEIRLYPGQRVRITGWKKCGDTKWRRPLAHFRTVTSHYAEMPSTPQHFTGQPKAPYGMYKTLKSDPFAEEFELFGQKKEEQPKEPPKQDFKPNQNLKHIVAGDTYRGLSGHDFTNPPMKAPKKLYHSTSIDNRASIQEHGLKKEESEAWKMGGGGAIFMSTKPGAFNMTSPTLDVWEIDTKGLKLELDQTTEWDDDDPWWCTWDNIPPNKIKLVHAGSGKSKSSKQAGAAKPVHEDIEGAPFKIGMAVRYVNPQDEEEAGELGTVGYLGHTGTVEYYEYSCGCGQTYPNDPMIGVRFPDGELHEFWADELEPADS